MRTSAETCVLIVDDDVHLRDAMAFAVQRKGFQVLGATSGNEAMELLKIHQVDIVLSDIRMTNGDGIELLKFIRDRHPTLPPVILVTGQSNVTPEQAMALGAHSVLLKPFERLKLIAELDRIIGYDRTQKNAA